VSDVKACLFVYFCLSFVSFNYDSGFFLSIVNIRTIKYFLGLILNSIVYASIHIRSNFAHQYHVKKPYFTMKVIKRECILCINLLDPEHVVKHSAPYVRLWKASWNYGILKFLYI
jgi:hypothetical protein